MRIRHYLPLGPAPLAIALVAFAAGAYLALHPVHKTAADLRLWTFAKNHYEAYLKAIPAFEKAHPGVKVSMELVHWEAVTSRLRAGFWADLDVPDLVEVEISAAGSFFRGPLEDIGFVDLTDWLQSSGWRARLVASRFAPYSSRGRIFGLPHDVHPVMLAYRRDIFEQEGVDVSRIKTWSDFIEIGRKLTRIPDRYMIELQDGWSGHLELLLFQRGGGYFDAAGNLTMDDPVALATLKWYVPLVAGPGRIGNSLPGGQVMTQALESGYLLSVFCPDWETRVLEVDVPRLSGKMALMPLPMPDGGGIRTSTWGGTMMGITKRCRHLELAKALAVYLYYDPRYLGERFAITNTLPPLKEAWNQAEFSRPREYWSGQPIGKLYAALAEQTPPQYTSPYIRLAKGKLGEAVAACTSYYTAHGNDGFDEFAERTLHRCADDVRRQMRRNPF